MIINELRNKIIKSQTFVEKITLLKETDPVSALLNTNEKIRAIYAALSPEEKYLFLSLVYIGQYPHLFDNRNLSSVKTLLNSLKETDHFFVSLGGLIGYHHKIMELLKEQTTKLNKHNLSFFSPPMIDISHDNDIVNALVEDGIKNLSFSAEIYPMGGVGDRLGLTDPETKQPLPVAALPFLGKTLLQGLLEDLQARENFYYQIYKKQVITPIIIMTCKQNNKTSYIKQLFEDNHWFDRPKDSVLFIQQLCVPVLSEEGQWITDENDQIITKPSGHGALWKTMLENEAFSWLYEKKRTKALIRQINNPVAGVDYGLLAFYGYGIKEEKKIGFSACPRKVGSAEGVDVIKQIKKDHSYDICLTNIEYTDFVKYNIEDKPCKDGSLFSSFPANTNILFIDLKSVEKAIKKCPFYGLVINMKTPQTIQLKDGKKKTVNTGRLESMMQNIADSFCKTSSSAYNPSIDLSLPTFATYNQRTKTLSATKRFYSPKSSIKETPEEAFYEILINHRDLLTNYCHMMLPKMLPIDKYIKEGPSFTTYLHPAIGPLYRRIAQKISQGRLSEFSEMRLDIADIQITNLDLDGSLIILSDQIFGRSDFKKNQYYNEYHGRCDLKDVTVVNQGIDRQQTNIYWKNKIHRKETFIIELKGNAKFYAQGVTFYGSHHIVVEDNTLLTVEQKDHKLVYLKKPLL